MTASSRTALTSSGKISGVGLANAKIRGRSAICATISCLRTPAADKPRKISAPGMTSRNVRADVSCAKRSLSGSISSVRPLYTTPAKSVTKMFSIGNPRSTIKSRHAKAAAPAPETTIFAVLTSFPTTFRPFMMAAPTIIAVPCWSSWKTGMRIRSRNLRSI